jgi:hypothetical protein
VGEERRRAGFYRAVRSGRRRKPVARSVSDRSQEVEAVEFRVFKFLDFVQCDTLSYW